MGEVSSFLPYHRDSISCRLRCKHPDQSLQGVNSRCLCPCSLGISPLGLSSSNHSSPVSPVSPSTPLCHPCSRLKPQLWFVPPSHSTSGHQQVCLAVPSIRDAPTPHDLPVLSVVISHGHSGSSSASALHPAVCSPYTNHNDPLNVVQSSSFPFTSTPVTFHDASDEIQILFKI